MDLSKFTPEQRACVTCSGRPLVVSAGAGSGKTFMLTQRIAYALLNPSESSVTGIDQVLAITFTEKAASEIKARVRSTLRAEGLSEEALAVDASWISTIHGMCSRILHERALELGLDPRFGLLDDTDRTALLREAINEVIAEVSLRRAANQDEDGEASEAEGNGPSSVVEQDYAALFDEYERSTGDSVIGAMVERLVNDAANVRGGLDAVVLGPDPASPRDVAQAALHATEEFYGHLLAHGFDIKGNAKATVAAKAREACEAPNGLPALRDLLDRRSLGYADVAGVLAAFSPSFGRWSKKCGDESVYVGFRLAYDTACYECALGIARVPLRQLVGLARRASERFEAKKAARGVLDQNDLLLRTLRAFERNEAGIADEYRNRFRLVMVDEFQDTSQLQIDIIGFLDGGEEGRHNRLCVVGDKQQSIYRFRGADVETYGAFQAKLCTAYNAQQEQLGKNWRSHGDIIEFVNRIFSQDDVFGTDDFIRLTYDEGHEQANPFAPGVPRIDIALTTGPSKGPFSASRRLPVEATAIARRFLELHDNTSTNRRWGDMVILLGTMSKADVYAQALRDEGIPCVVAGGSTFGRAPEAQVICQLASAVANPDDDGALGAVLASDMFGLSPDELLRLATRPSGGSRGFWEGLRARGASDPSPRVRLASAVLREAAERCGRDNPARVLSDAVLSSGWLDRLRGTGPAGTVDEQGMAVAANVLKALRLVEGFADDPQAPRSMASVAARLRTKFAEGMKEAPGALNVAGQDAVRLMTIHASKGLEFPIVAMAEFYKGVVSSAKLAIETVGDRLCLTLGPGRSCSDAGAFSPLADRMKDYGAQLAKVYAAAAENAGEAPASDPDDPCEAESATQFARAIKARASAGELAEMHRKAYVGMTRPREALIVAAHPNNRPKSSQKDDASFYPAAFDDVRRGIAGPDNDLATLPEGYAFDAAFTPDHRVCIACEHLASTCEDAAGPVTLCGAQLGDGQVGEIELDEYLGTADEGLGEQAPVTVLVPEYIRIDEVRPRVQPAPSAQAGLISYSYLAPDHDSAASDPDETGRGKPAPQVDDEDGASPSDAVAQAEATSNRADPTAFGSTFHAAAQWMAEQARTLPGDAAPGLPLAQLTPDDDRLRTLARTWGLADDALPRLREALTRWANSDVAREAYRHARVQAEAPLFAHVDGPTGEPLYLNGAIDLLCTDETTRAFIVDYKTGGSPDETPGQLEAKHRLQAQCYAYATLASGYDTVDIAFVRVEQPDPADTAQPQVVRYAFEHAQLPQLAEAIQRAYAAKHGFAAPEPH
ncbi:MAG: UvrD-helicase domain-containing protein [Coriobacteriia bacterium]|nr:UvrD-helicase domain-containing protein [Coriobacteriia bacterium]MBS5477105.1 UvrD-helicase domain-containing protein [Coriobacteriia bacterium]